MKSFIFFLFIILIAQSCKKDKLDEDKSVFIGKWRWVYTIKTIRECDSGNTNTLILTPISENVNYAIKFLKKGCVTFYENDEKIEKYRTVFSSGGWRNDNNPNFIGYTYFSFNLNNKPENSFSGYVKTDTLVEIGYWFPFKLNGYDCTTYISYFVKE
jgi:hypothetical protein